MYHCGFKGASTSHMLLVKEVIDSVTCSLSNNLAQTHFHKIIYFFLVSVLVLPDHSCTDAFTPIPRHRYGCYQRSFITPVARKGPKNKGGFGVLWASPKSDDELNTRVSRYDLGTSKNEPPRSSMNSTHAEEDVTSSRSTYNLGLGKNTPLAVSDDARSVDISSQSHVMDAVKNWPVPMPNEKNDIYLNESRAPTSTAKKNVTIAPKSTPQSNRTGYTLGVGKNAPLIKNKKKDNNDPEFLSRALYKLSSHSEAASETAIKANDTVPVIKSPEQNEVITSKSSSSLTYDKIDLSIPPSVYCPSENIDLVWDLMRDEARREADREPLLVSFLFSTILNHVTLESALAFHLANRLSSPTMMSTQIMSLISEALEGDEVFRRSLRADMLAVRDRDPACTCLPDVFLYFKGFHALQTHRVAHYLWKHDRKVLSHFLQSQVSQSFQIDIHPNATLGSGILLDHGTGVVIGETAVVGNNCSILHHVTLGGSGKRGVDRHPKIGNGVLLGAGASVLGNIKIGDGVQIGAGTLVIGDLPPHSVAVGVPAKIIGSFADNSLDPSIGMNQVGSKEYEEMVITFESAGI